MQTAFLLIALGFGYKIFSDAIGSKIKSAKMLGIMVGIFIMVVAFFGTLCKTAAVIKRGASCRSSLCPLEGTQTKKSDPGAHHCPHLEQKLSGSVKDTTP